MSRGRWVALVALAWMIGGSRAADLTRARAEPNLEKRARLALAESDAAFAAVRSDYQHGYTDKVEADAAQIVAAVDLADLSLDQTGKNPRKSPRWFKYAEIQTRELLRKLDALQQDMSFSERPLLDKTKAEVQRVHDKLLMGLMEGKPK
ncbi:MAG TPA: hypothetical protein VIN93_13655 [Bryobacteraceae bacterium]|jgi:hypothetical protein